MPKVLHLLDALKLGGAEQSLLQILKRLQGTEPAVCYLYHDATLRDAYERAGIPVTGLGLRGKYPVVHAVRAVEEVVARERPDLIHATLFDSEIVARLVGRRTGVPVIGSFVNDSYAPHRWQRLSAVQRAKLVAVQQVDRFTARWAAHFVANSEAVKQSHAPNLGVPLDRVTVIHRGREPGAYAPSPPEQRGAVRHQLGVGADAAVVVNVARLLERKGQAELIRGWPLVRREFPGAQLLLVGEGEHRPALEPLAADPGLGGSVRLLGQRTDIPALLGAADVFAFPSHYEGLPGALLEAMFAALPIVATDISMHREAVEHGRSAVLVPVGDPAALGAAIVGVLRDPEGARRLGAGARAAALARFDVDGIAARYDAFYAFQAAA